MSCAIDHPSCTRNLRTDLFTKPCFLTGIQSTLRRCGWVELLLFLLVFVIFIFTFLLLILQLLVKIILLLLFLLFLLQKILLLRSRKLHLLLWYRRRRRDGWRRGKISPRRVNWNRVHLSTLMRERLRVFWRYFIVVHIKILWFVLELSGMWLRSEMSETQIFINSFLFKIMRI